VGCQPQECGKYPAMIWVNNIYISISECIHGLDKNKVIHGFYKLKGSII
jgi:hypothetical protein